MKLKQNYEDEHKQYFETAITVNQTNIDTAIENAEKSNKETILEMIDPTPSQVVIDTFNPNDQHLQSFQDDFTSKLPNQIQQKLTDILTEVKEKTKKINNMTPKNIIQGNILTRRQHQAVSKLIEKTKKGGNSEEIS